MEWGQLSKRHGWGFKTVQVVVWLAIGGVNMAGEIGEVGVILTWQPMWWR